MARSGFLLRATIDLGLLLLLAAALLAIVFTFVWLLGSGWPSLSWAQILGMQSAADHDGWVTWYLSLGLPLSLSLAGGALVFAAIAISSAQDW